MSSSFFFLVLLKTRQHEVLGAAQALGRAVNNFLSVAMASSVEEGALHAPLISGSSLKQSNNNSSATSAVKKITTWLLAFLLWAAFLFWIAILVLFPTLTQRRADSSSSNTSGTSAAGHESTGLPLLMFAAPVFLIAVFGLFYLHVKPPSYVSSSPRKPKISLWTHPVLVDGLLGVVSAAELLFILAFIGYSVWFMAYYVIHDASIVKMFMGPRTRGRFNLWQLWTFVVGLRLGFLGLVFMGFLLLPVARGSTLLRLIDIPFEHAVKYHVWLGHLTMAVFTIHGLCFCVVWIAQGRLIEELLAWQSAGVPNLAGVISLAAGILIWLTSFGYVRKGYFELFFYTHQLYVVFIVFMAFHVGGFAFCVCLAGILLYLLDRFMRFCQSRRGVQVLASRVLPCGTIELLLAKPPSLPYNSLSFIFLCVPRISWLQWHPFSVSSSPYDGKDNVSLLIKPLGSWTKELEKHAEMTDKCSVLGVEGPYGHESNYYLKYEALLLVAGGIGVSPFIALLRDLLHRVNMNEPGLPAEVTLVWAVKSSKELSTINLVQPEVVCPGYASRLKLAVHAFVTRQAQPDTEEGAVIPAEIRQYAKKPLPGCQISTLSATFNIYWMAAYIVISVAGFFLVEGALQKFILGPGTSQHLDEKNEMAGSSWTARVATLLLSMVCGVMFGGLVLLAWNYIVKFGGGFAGLHDGTESKKPVSEGASARNLVGPWNTVYGHRPDLKEFFDGFVHKKSCGNVGVLVCGPETLQSSVAIECRAYNTQRQADMVFHYHSVSFDL